MSYRKARTRHNEIRLLLYIQYQPQSCRKETISTTQQ